MIPCVCTFLPQVSPECICTSDSDNVAAFTELREILTGLFSREHFKFWLRTPHVDLGGQSPGHLILNGRANEVLDVAHRIRERAAQAAARQPLPTTAPKEPTP